MTAFDLYRITSISYPIEREILSTDSLIYRLHIYLVIPIRSIAPLI